MTGIKKVTQAKNAFEGETISPSLFPKPVLIPLIIIGGVFAFIIGSYIFGSMNPGDSNSNSASDYYQFDDAVIGKAWSHDFASAPELIPSLDPEGSNGPYTFYLGSGTGFPPMGLILSPDGKLSGTPTGQGGKFQVCVKDIGGTFVCRTYLLNTVSAGQNSNNNDELTGSFVGDWVSFSPATYYIKDIDGERYAQVSANFNLKITYDGKYYIGAASMKVISSQTIGDSGTPIINYENPLSFDARNYADLVLPYSGISQVEITGTTMTVITPFSEGNQKIFFKLVNVDSRLGSKDALYATASVVPTSSGQSMGEESDSEAIVLVRK